MANYLTYDRDINTTGSITANNFVPEYGSSVSFEFLDFSFNTEDNHKKTAQKELNNFLLDFDLRFSQKTEDEAKSLISFLEKVSTGISGAETNFNFNENNSDNVSIDFPTGSIYKNMSGLLIGDYQVNFHNGFFDVDLNLKTNLENTYTRWKDSVFLNPANTNDFTSGTTYEKFDIIYANENIHYFLKQYDDRQRYFYISSGQQIDTINQLIDGVTGQTQTITRDFFFEPDDKVSIAFADSTNVLKFDSSIQESQNLSRNKNIIKNLSLSFSNRSDKETFCLLHFLEKNDAPKFFKLNLPKLFTRDKFFKINTFKHTFVYKDCNNIEVDLEEVVESQKEPQPIHRYYLAKEYSGVSDFESFPLATENFETLVLENSLETDAKAPPVNVFFGSVGNIEYLDAALRFNLSWTNNGGTDEGFDLDLNVVDPQEVTHNYTNLNATETQDPSLRYDRRGEDENVPDDNEVTENIYWYGVRPGHEIPIVTGIYGAYVNMFNKNTNHSSCDFTLRVFESGVRTQTYSGSFNDSQRLDTTSAVFEYTYIGSGTPEQNEKTCD